MVATWNPAAHAGYYTQSVAYYANAREATGVWYAPGGDFGLVDGEAVDPARLEQLFEARGADGVPLLDTMRRQHERVAAYDATFSPPRSVSLVWAFAEPELKQAIAQAHHLAVREGLRHLEAEGTLARRGRGGAVVQSVRLSAALFQHHESRPSQHANGEVYADPNLHTHAVLLNLATRADGTVGALHSVVQRQHVKAVGSVYHLQLSHELQRLGFTIDRVGENGIFEIAGVDRSLIEAFSGRRREIEEELAQQGVSSRQAVALAAAVAKATRGGKSKAAINDLHQVWARAAAAHGVDVERFSEAMRVRDPVAELVVDEEEIAERLARLPEDLTKATAVIERRDLLRAVASALVGTGAGAERVVPLVNELVASGAFIAIGQDRSGLLRYSTPEMVALERRLAGQARVLAEAEPEPLDLDDLRRRCGEAGLSAEQTNAAVGACATGSLGIVHGSAGTGKTTTLKPVVEAFEAQGYRVLGAAVAWRMAHALRDELGVDSRALASRLARIESGLDVLDPQTLLVVDEAGLIGLRDGVPLLDAVARSGARLLLVGDPHQLLPIGPGSALAIMGRAVEAARVETIVRQHEPWMREAVAHLRDGHAAEALDLFSSHGRLIEAEGPLDAVTRLVDLWLADRRRHPDQSSVLLARTHRQLAAITREVRDRLKADGAIHGPELTLDAVTPSGGQVSLQVAAGDRIRFLRRNDELGVVNGTMATVLSLENVSGDPADARITVEVDGRTQTFRPREFEDKRGRVRIASGFAQTIYAAQGLTVDRAYVLLDQQDRRDAYVAASRARHETWLVYDARAIDRQILAEAATGTRVEQRPEPAERRDMLARRLARANEKLAALDVIDADATRRGREASRQREQELSHEL